MSVERLVALIEQLRPPAVAALHRYAAEAAPHVDPTFVAALGQALGTISFDEALAAIDAAEQEAAG
jgi:hypothetical protein